MRRAKFYLRAGATVAASVFLLSVGQAQAKSKAKAGTQKTTVSVVFDPKDRQAMSDAVYNSVDSSSASYHQYLSTAQVAKTYGRSTSQLNQFKKYFKRYKVTTSTYPGNLIMKVTGRYKDVVKAFHAKLNKSHKKVTYKLPKTLAKQVDSVVGLTIGQTKKKIKTKHKAATNNMTPDLSIKGEAFAKKYGAQRFIDAYQVNELYKQGLTGQGQGIGIVTMSDFNVGDVSTFLKQNGLPSSTSRIAKHYSTPKKAILKTLKSANNMQSQAEASLDVEQAVSVAPQAKVDVFIGDTATSVKAQTLPDEAFLNTFSDAISKNIDKQITTSYNVGNEVLGLGKLALSETKAQLSRALDMVFMQAALQGITVFNASGDHGASDIANKKLNLSIPTSAYEVEVGGTTLPFSQKLNGQQVTVTKERAWGQLQGLSKMDLAQGNFEGSGGGFSILNPTPRYQVGFPGVNTFNAINHLKFQNGRFVLNPNAKMISGVGSGRNVPDVSGNAYSQPGYALYYKSPIGKVWMLGSGTSYVAPQMAATNALMNSGLKSPIGFWNPQIYNFAKQANSPFTPLQDTVNNDNLYYTGQPGKLYNQATGLGTVNFSKLYTLFNQ
ncbi:protease pro-enzyme activation domain-containing protein [uncultured Secundilactobacillus sp.]|uniref:S53 family peptidase n=1 Tax=uncultured Secundilactobacillus sp. TaxID=2813935 RepID=UPI00258DB5C8|nr:S53 family peptidase [uncultured Secundilactobacillus sp.]